MGIKSLELDPTWKNVYNTLVADAVGHNKNLWQFACFCSVQESRCSIALDSGWGTGKTFFLKQLEMIFNCIDLKENEREEIENVFSECRNSNAIVNELKPHVCVYYDAWLNDNAEDPMQSILYCLIKHKSEQFLKQSKVNEESKKKIIAFANSVKEFVKVLCQFNTKKDLILDAIAPLENLVPLGLGKITESIKASNPTHDIEVQKSFHDAFDKFLKSLIPSDNTRLLILIDELDRCKPTYAVQLLERIKHYLSSDRVTFVFAINDEQLQYTIKAFYGDEFNAHQYLDRFFDHRLVLPQIDNLKFEKYYGFCQSKQSTPSQDTDIDSLLMETCNSFLESFPLSMREELKFRSQVKVLSDSARKDRRFINNSSWWLVVFVLLPFLLGLRLKDKKLYNDFVNGKNEEPILPVIATSRHITCLLSDPEHYRTSSPLAFRNMQEEKAFKNFDTVYQCLFVDKLRKQTHVEIQPFFLDREMIDILFSALGFMADFIKYDTNTEETANG